MVSASLPVVIGWEDRQQGNFGFFVFLKKNELSSWLVACDLLNHRFWSLFLNLKMYAFVCVLGGRSGGCGGTGSIPYPMQWVKGSCIATALAQVATVAWIQSLAWELPICHGCSHKIYMEIYICISISVYIYTYRYVYMCIYINQLDSLRSFCILSVAMYCFG